MFRRNNGIVHSLLNNKDLSQQEISKIDELQNQIYNIKKNKNNILIKEFLDKHVRYNFESLTLVSDIRKYFKSFCYKQNVNNIENIQYVISVESILKYNDNFKIKNYSFCRSCKKRYRFGCCSKSSKYNRVAKPCCAYLELIDIEQI